MTLREPPGLKDQALPLALTMRAVGLAGRAEPFVQARAVEALAALPARLTWQLPVDGADDGVADEALLHARELPCAVGAPHQHRVRQRPVLASQV